MNAPTENASSAEEKTLFERTCDPLLEVSKLEGRQSGPVLWKVLQLYNTLAYFAKRMPAMSR